jgi:alpha-glucosidase (family GH31 glycosyl hydrolase)
MHFHNGMPGEEMHNLYPLLYHRSTRAIFDQYMHEHPDRQLWFYTRSGYSTVGDLPGSAASDNGNFGGDNNADWAPSDGIQSLAPDMLNRAVGGAAGYTTDIGGYNGAPTAELFIRWAEWATLSPYMRIHNNDGSGTSQPWSFDPQTEDIYRYYAQLRESAKPYLQGLWQEFEQDGIPPTRPLWLQFPGDTTAAHQQQEWMLGDDVLVAPVVTQSATQQQVYFPAGCWQDPVSGTQYTGPTTATVSAPLNKLPFYFVCGTAPFTPPPAG